MPDGSGILPTSICRMGPASFHPQLAGWVPASTVPPFGWTHNQPVKKKCGGKQHQEKKEKKCYRKMKEREECGIPVNKAETTFKDAAP